MRFTQVQIKNASTPQQRTKKDFSILPPMVMDYSFIILRHARFSVITRKKTGSSIMTIFRRF